MKNIKIKIQIFFILAVGMLLPFVSLAQNEPQANYMSPFNEQGISAQAYVVMDKTSGKILLQKNSNEARSLASLTKLVSALVILDLNPELNGSIAMRAKDEVGGSRLATRSGAVYKIKDLFYASLIASANNAIIALSRSARLSPGEFVFRMNLKAKELGANNTLFIEPSGLNSGNVTTAGDFAKIASVAFSHPEIQKASTAVTYKFASLNRTKKIYHNIQSTDLLLQQREMIVVGGKTGFTDEAQNNFASELKDVDGKNIIVVVLGAKDRLARFEETKKLAIWSWISYSWPKLQKEFVGLKMPQQKLFNGQVAGAILQPSGGN